MRVGFQMYRTRYHIIRRGHKACNVDCNTVNRDSAVGSHTDMARTVLDDDGVIVLQPRELCAGPVTESHTVILERRELVGHRPEAWEKERILRIVESTDGIRSDTTRLEPPVDASLTEQDVAFATWVDLILDVVVITGEIYGRLDDRGWVKCRAVQVHTGDADLHLSELCHGIEREDVTGRRSGDTFHHFSERFP